MQIHDATEAAYKNGYNKGFEEGQKQAKESLFPAFADVGNEHKRAKLSCSSNIIPLEVCPMCDKGEVFASYEEKRRYKYKCNKCGQYFEFNAPSQFAADTIFNKVIRGRIK